MVDANLGGEIVALCDKMAELIRQFKVFARKSEGPPSVVDLRLAVDGALKIIRAQHSSSGIVIDWHRPEQPVMCHGDLIRIEQVMVNLVANAVQAVEGRDEPLIEIMIDEEEGGSWRCRVRDNGHGLPGNTEKVFEPFFTTRSVKQGGWAWGGFPFPVRSLKLWAETWSATIVTMVRVPSSFSN